MIPLLKTSKRDFKRLKSLTDLVRAQKKGIMGFLYYLKVFRKKRLFSEQLKNKTLRFWNFS